MFMTVNEYKQNTFPNKFNHRERKNAKTVSRKLNKKLAMQEKNRHDQAMAESRTEKMAEKTADFKINTNTVFIDDQN
jgi:hypothetical protein